MQSQIRSNRPSMNGLAVVLAGVWLSALCLSVWLQASPEDWQVRIRSACGLSRLKNHLEDILYLALKTQDAYAIQELVSELERSGGIFELVTALGDSRRRARAEAALLAALRGGCRRILLDLVLHHENWRTRGTLARLLSRSGDPELPKMMELFDSPGLPLRKRRVLGWLARQLAPAQSSLSLAVKVVA